MADGGDAAAAAVCVSESSVDATQGAAADAVQCQNAEATSSVTEAAPPAAPLPDKSARQVKINDALAVGAMHKRRVGVSLLAHLVEAKCGDALPIHRQSQQFARYGVTVPLNTL